MRPPHRSLTPSRAAARLGISVKALRIYERHGLPAPQRTAAGWRVYAPEDVARAAEVVTLRALGLSFARIGRVLGGDLRDLRDLEAGLAAHALDLERQARHLAATLDRVQGASVTAFAAGRRPPRPTSPAPWPGLPGSRGLRAAVALGRGMVRPGAHRAADLHHGASRQRQDAPRQAAGRGSAGCGPPGPGSPVRRRAPAAPRRKRRSGRTRRARPGLAGRRRGGAVGRPRGARRRPGGLHGRRSRRGHGGAGPERCRAGGGGRLSPGRGPGDTPRWF